MIKKEINGYPSNSTFPLAAIKLPKDFISLISISVRKGERWIAASGTVTQTKKGKYLLLDKSAVCEEYAISYEAEEPAPKRSARSGKKAGGSKQKAASSR